MWAIPMISQFALLSLLGSRGTFSSPTTLFWLVTIAASSCVIPASMLIVRSTRTRSIELSFVGLFYLAVSVLPLVHGLTVPGVLVGNNTSTMTSVFWAIPVGVVLASPTLLPMRWQRRLVPRYWRQWTIGGIFVVSGFAGLLLVNQNLLTMHEPGSAFAMVVATFSILGCIALSVRGLELARIAQRAIPLAPSAGYSFVAASATMWFVGAEYSVGFWIAHSLDIVGVLLGSIGAIVMLRSTKSIHEVVTPALAADPLAALEVGLDPIIHRYINDLAEKDQITRDHVVRTCELSVLVAEELGYTGTLLRHIGLVGLLHDVGKLEIPDEILKKPSSLTSEEFAVVKNHPIAGERLALQSPVLRPLARGIRTHHERVDGGGYPDGLAGEQIALEARIVSACDAYDAMSHTRQYRRAMDNTKVISIMREHAGTQWDANVVDALLVVAGRKGKIIQDTPVLAIGSVTSRIGCDCLPEIEPIAA